MAQVNSENSTTAPAIPDGLLAQERQRQADLKELRRLKREAADEVERLLTFLDAVDGYTLTECEPSLGAPEVDRYHYHGADQTERMGGIDDLEAPDDDEPSLCGVTAGSINVSIVGEIDAEQEQDDEPSLGSLERHCSMYGPWEGRSEVGSQEQWSAGGTLDREDEHDGGEPENEGGEGVHEDDEPSLGWTIDGVKGAYHDRELAHD